MLFLGIIFPVNSVSDCTTKTRRILSYEAGDARSEGITEIKSVTYVPMSHPFVERLIGTIRREYLDVALFWTAVDLESKLAEFRDY